MTYYQIPVLHLLGPEISLKPLLRCVTLLSNRPAIVKSTTETLPVIMFTLEEALYMDKTREAVL